MIFVFLVPIWYIYPSLWLMRPDHTVPINPEPFFLNNLSILSSLFHSVVPRLFCIHLNIFHFRDREIASNWAGKLFLNHWSNHCHLLPKRLKSTFSRKQKLQRKRVTEQKYPTKFEIIGRTFETVLDIWLFIHRTNLKYKIPPVHFWGSVAFVILNCDCIMIQGQLPSHGFGLLSRQYLLMPFILRINALHFNVYCATFSMLAEGVRQTHFRNK